MKAAIYVRILDARKSGMKAPTIDCNPWRTEGVTMEILGSIGRFAEVSSGSTGKSWRP